MPRRGALFARVGDIFALCAAVGSLAPGKTTLVNGTALPSAVRLQQGRGHRVAGRQIFVVQQIDKALTGIGGFDEMTGGGLPRSRSTLVIGSPGAGKTIFAIQSLVNGAREHGEPGIFVAFEEHADHIRENAAGFGWDLPMLEKESLFFLDAHMPLDVVQSGQFDLSAVLATVAARVEAMGARRVVFDAIDVLLALLDDPAAERRELYRLNEWLIGSGLTGIITAKIQGNGEEVLPERYGFLQFMVDCVVRLDHNVVDMVSQRNLRVVKYRGSGFHENESPMVIGNRGVEVAGPDPLRREGDVVHERVSTGVPGLDRMLGGGYYRGTHVLITGEPGTAKSTLCGAFVEAACLRGERALYVGFDEGAAELVRNLKSVNVDLEPHLESGRLLTHTAYASVQGTEAHYLQLKSLIEEHEPTCVAIDPISAMLKAGGTVEAAGVAQRVVHLAKALGVTTVSTSLLTVQSPDEAQLRVSTLADTWIRLMYQEQGGERNRALSILKSRGTAHSNQVRELLLGDEGVTLADVYTAGGEVLMGTLRWEREEAERRERERRRLAQENRRRELEAAEAEMEAKIASLRRELETKRAELEQLEADADWRERKRNEQEQEVRRRRRRRGREAGCQGGEADEQRGGKGEVGEGA